MTWISARKPQRKIPCVYAGPHIQPAQRPRRQGLGSCCPTRAKLDGGAESQPTHFPQPACGGAAGACLCLSGGAATCVACVVQPDHVPTLSSWRGACGYAPSPQAPIMHHHTYELATVGGGGGASLKENVDPPNPIVCPVSVLLHFSDHSCKCQRTWPLARAASPGMCLLFALSNPLVASPHPFQLSDPCWLPPLSAGYKFQILY